MKRSAALKFAFAEAAASGCVVRAIRSWRSSPAALRGNDIEEAECHALRELVHRHQSHPPGVGALTHLPAGHAAEVLIEASRTARLLVAGAHGSGSFRGLLLGSVSQQVLLHAHCPIAIVR